MKNTNATVEAFKSIRKPMPPATKVKGNDRRKKRDKQERKEFRKGEW